MERYIGNFIGLIKGFLYVKRIEAYILGFRRAVQTVPYLKTDLGV